MPRYVYMFISNIKGKSGCPYSYFEELVWVL